MNTKINYLFILIGGMIAIYAKSNEEQNEYILVGGIALLMIGIYRLARNIPSNADKEDDSNDI